MARISIGDIELGWREWGEGVVTVLFIHGNLASKDWIELCAPHFPRGVRTIGIDWRGCGDSDRPASLPDYSNYSMQQHALDLLCALDALNVDFCHLATHSTGGLIAIRMLLAQPERFGRVFHLDPVSPAGIPFTDDQIGFFRAMAADRGVTRSAIAGAASSLFEPTSLAPGSVPRFLPSAEASRALFERVVDQSFGVSSGIWIGTPHNLNLEYERGELMPQVGKISHAQLVLWGEQDKWINVDDLRRMAEAMPDCRLVTLPGIAHSLNLEVPELYAGYFGAWFGGLTR